VVKFTFLLFLFIAIGAQASSLNDPTKPINYKASTTIVAQDSSATLPTLQSILGSSGNLKAIINNELYSVGQKVNGYRITNITSDAVSLAYQGKSYRLTLYPDNKKLY